MKIAFFQPYLASWRIEFLERYLADSSNEVIVYDGGFSPKKDLKAVAGNSVSFPVRRLKSFSPVLKFRKQSYPLYFSPGLFFDLLRRRPDCIVTEGEINFLNNISVALYCFLFGKSYVWWSLGKVRTRKKNLLNKILDPLIDFLLKNAHCVMARNGYARDYYLKEKGIPESQVILAPNSVDDERALSEVTGEAANLIKMKNGGKVLLYVGAMTPEKRPEDLVQVLQILHSRGRKDIAVWFVGDGPEKNRLEDLVKVLGLEGSCKFWGKKIKGVGDYFLASDVVAVPGLGGLVINHAMVFARPVVSRLADGTELDLIENGKSGYLLNDYDNENFANALLKVIDSSSYDSMCQSARDVVQNKWNMRLMIKGVNDCVGLAVSRR